MWDYDKLFAIGNIIGFYVPLIEKYTVHVIDEKQKNILHNYYKNKLLLYSGPICSYEDMKTKIQYIVRLDEHGNVIEKLFDREKDLPNFMPELKTGMFVTVVNKKIILLMYHVMLMSNKINYFAKMVVGMS